MASLEVQIAASNNDGYIYSGGYNKTEANNYYGRTTVSVNYWLLFSNVTIPAGATINSAVIRHVASQNQSGTTCKEKIYAEAADNPSYPTSESDYNSRTKTTAYVSWTLGSWTAESTYDSVDISTVMQEIVNRSG